MRFFLLLPFLLIACLPAHAQTAAPPAIETPACFPFVNGTHTMAPRIAEGPLGKHIFWECSLRGAEPRIYGWSCAHADCLGSAARAAMQAITSATARVSAAQTQYRQAMAFDCPNVMQEDSPRGALCRERYDVLLANILEWHKDAATP